MLAGGTCASVGACGSAHTVRAGVVVLVGAQWVLRARRAAPPQRRHGELSTLVSQSRSKPASYMWEGHTGPEFDT